MKFKKFDEYLVSKNKTITTAPVEKVAEFKGTIPAKPEKEKKDKDSGGSGQVGSPYPYKSGSDAKDPNKEDKSGLAYKGDNKLKYEPKTEEAPKKVPSWPKTKMQEWLDKTKKMSTAEFAKNIKSDIQKGLDECQQPLETVKNAVKICKCNEQHISVLVRELKRNQMFESFFNEMIQHPECYKIIANLMENEFHSKKLMKAMNELADPSSIEENPFLKKKFPEKDMLDSGEGEGEDRGEEMGDEEAPEDSEELEGEEGEMGDEEAPEDLEEPSEDDSEGIDALDNDSGVSPPIGDENPHKRSGLDALLKKMRQR
ncbi:MAG: hypothetical protein EKK64_10265 [Neisseriaceae bacterium]|nr:MAG: hypothetical protein EKK64_10265 [Neisseriaceae bacterium]